MDQDSRKEPTLELAYRDPARERSLARHRRRQWWAETGDAAVTGLLFLMLIGGGWLEFVVVRWTIRDDQPGGIAVVLYVLLVMFLVGRGAYRRLFPVQTGYELNLEVDREQLKRMVVPTAIRTSHTRHSTPSAAAERLAHGPRPPRIVQPPVASVSKSNESKVRWRKLRWSARFGALGNGVLFVLAVPVVALGFMIIYRPLTLTRILVYLFGHR